MEKSSYCLAVISTRINEVIGFITQLEKIPFDVAKYEFKNSITYKMIINSSSDFVSILTKEILEVYKKELVMKSYLDSILCNGTKEKTIINDVIKEVTIQVAIKEELTIEQVYRNFINSRAYTLLCENDYEDINSICEAFYQELGCKKRKKIYCNVDGS